jgi:hypothetical protein
MACEPMHQELGEQAEALPEKEVTIAGQKVKATATEDEDEDEDSLIEDAAILTVMTACNLSA